MRPLPAPNLLSQALLTLLGLSLLTAATDAAERWRMSQGWDFFRPAEDCDTFVPDETARIAAGEFSLSPAPQETMFAPHSARQICLVLDAGHKPPFASLAEFELLDTQKKSLPRRDWKIVHASSDSTASGEAVENLIDGKPDTIWHSAWKTPAKPPHTVVIDLGSTVTFSGFRALQRQEPGAASGFAKGWRLYASVRPFALPARPLVDPLAGKAPWEKVNLPHTVRLEALNASGCRNYQGVAWYRKRFTTDPAWRGKVALLRFEGAMQVADIWLNGEKLTTHFGGYQPFVLDLSDKLRFGTPNTLVVKLDNSDNPEVPPGKPQSGLDFTYFGGLYRDVYLDVADKLRITDEIRENKVAGGGVFVRYPEVSKERAVVSVDTEVANDHPSAKSIRLRHTLVNAAGATVATVTTAAPTPLAPGARVTLPATLEVKSPALWHPEHPHLHTLRTEVLDGDRVTDTRTTRIGIRRIQFTPEGFRINGERFFPSGFNRHQDHPYVGYALSDSQHYRDVKKLREAGFTAYRCHYPAAPAFMDACDELGVLCFVSNPGWQFWNNSKTFFDRCVQNAREMVRRDRNRPSVMLWEPGLNETYYTEKFCRDVNAAVHEEYPGDQCFTGGDGEIAKGHAVFDVEFARETKPGKPVITREWGDSVDDWTSQQGRVRVARGWGETPLITQAQNHVFKLDAIYKSVGKPETTGLNGILLWAGIDCYRGYHHQPFLGGVLDLFRIPKFDYHFFRSQRPAAKLDLPSGVDSGPMVFIANYGTSWSPADVMVFSNCEEVRFSEGGKVIATKKPDSGTLLNHPPFTFHIGGAGTDKDTYYMNVEAGYHFKPAEYKAEGLIDGKVVATHIVKAPMVMSELRLDPDLEGRPLVADGSDFIRVHAHITDRIGTTHPMANDLVTFSVQGEGAIIGDATIGANPVAAEAGIATVLVRASTRPGKIIVRATAPGLKPAEVVLESKPAPDKFVAN